MNVSLLSWYMKLISTTKRSSTTTAVPRVEYKDIPFFVFYYLPMAALSVLCIIGNGIIIHVLPRHASLRTPANYFLLSLAVADLFHGILYPIHQVGHMEIPAVSNAFGKFVILPYFIFG